MRLLAAVVCLLGLTSVLSSKRVVHPVPHSHCDVGWLYTPDTYFYRGTHETGSVKDILTTVVANLDADPSLRFVWAETVWVSWWWKGASDSQHDAFRRVVASGQLEILAPGWSMSDESTPTSAHFIADVSVGHEWFLNMFPDVKIQHAWQIDMFSGFSGFSPSVWRQAAMNASVIRWEGASKMHDEWVAAKRYQYNWRSSKSSDDTMFTHIINGNYGDLMGAGLNWGEDASGPVTPENLWEFASKLEAIVAEHAQAYQDAAPLMLPWGSDFRFGNATRQFSNMTQVVKYVNNAGVNFTAKFSTLADYFDDLHATPGLKFPVVDAADFANGYNDFLYGWPHPIHGYDETIQFQTGCSTTWPFYKRAIRVFHATLRAAEQQFALVVARDGWSASSSAYFDNITAGRESLGIVAHHDSLPGTAATKWSMPSKYGQYDDVVGWYATLLQNTTVGLNRVIADMTVALVGGSTAPNADPLSVAVVNTLGFSRAEPVGVTIPPKSTCTVTDGAGKVVPTQVVGGTECAWVADVPPLGTQVFSVSVTPGVPVPVTPPLSTPPPPGTTSLSSSPASPSTFSLSNGVITATFSNSTGQLLTVSNHASNVSVPVNAEMMTFINGTGGAYILVESSEPVPVPPTSFSVVHGDVVSGVCQTFGGSEVTQHCAFVHSAATTLAHAVEFVTLAGPLSLRSELLLRLTTGLSSATLFTADMGEEAHDRPRRLDVSTGGNFHTCVDVCGLHTESGDAAQVTLMPQHTKGVQSPWDGVMDLLLHRRGNTSDSQGPWPVNDTTTVEVRVLLHVGSHTQALSQRHGLADAVNHPLYVVPGVGTAARPVVTPLKGDVAPPAQLFDFMVRGPPGTGSTKPEMVLRLHHQAEKGDVGIDGPVTVDVDTLFSPTGVVGDLTEKTLTLRQDAASVHRRVWPSVAEEGSGENQVTGNTTATVSSLSSAVQLSPMQFRTFTMTLGKQVE